MSEDATSGSPTNKTLRELKKTPPVSGKLPHTYPPLTKRFLLPYVCQPGPCKHKHTTSFHVEYIIVHLHGVQFQQSRAGALKHRRRRLSFHFQHNVMGVNAQIPELTNTIGQSFYAIFYNCFRCRYSAQLLAEIKSSLHQGYQAQPNAP